MTKAEAIKWLRQRACEPSTWAGIAAGALAVADIAKEAESVSAVYKEAGPLAGGVALVSALAAIVKGEKKKDGDIIDAEFKEVKDK